MRHVTVPTGTCVRRLDTDDVVNYRIEESYVFFGSRTFVLREIISPDAGMLMDEQLALDLWDVVIAVLRSTSSTKTPSHPASGYRCETGFFFAKHFQTHTRGKPKFSAIVACESCSHEWTFSRGESQL